MTWEQGVIARICSSTAQPLLLKTYVCSKPAGGVCFYCLNMSLVYEVSDFNPSIRKMLNFQGQKLNLKVQEGSGKLQH